jgi:O-antigen/teichoic acid export membrane protein
MNQQYGVIEIGMAIVVILLAVLYRARSDRTKFRWLFLVGYMGLAGGMMASGLVNFWYGFGLFVSWFAVAGYFYFQERQERSHAPH